MNRSVVQIFIVFALLVGLTAAVLVRVRTRLNLGKPGVKIVAVPLYDPESNLVASSSVYLPSKVANFSSTLEPVTKPELQMLPPDTIFGRRLYTAPDHFTIGASVVLMGTDRTSIHKPQYCLVGQGEAIMQSEVVTIPMTKPFPYDLNVMKLTTRSQRSISKGHVITLSGMYIYWFVADGELTPLHGQRMWWMAKDMLATGVLQRWAYISYFARCMPGKEDELFSRMKAFITDIVPEIQTTPSADQPKFAVIPARTEPARSNNFGLPSFAEAPLSMISH
jgi:hypothetical protein